MKFAYTGIISSAADTGEFMVIFRPEVQFLIHGPRGTREIRALVDTGADNTILPASAARALGIPLKRTTGPAAQAFGGQEIALSYADVKLELLHPDARLRWLAHVYFRAGLEDGEEAALLGQEGFLEFFTAVFYGDDCVLDLEPKFALAPIGDVNRAMSKLLRALAIGFESNLTTNTAGACLVASGTKAGDRLIVVVLGASPSDARYDDARAPLQMGMATTGWREALRAINGAGGMTTQNRSAPYYPPEQPLIMAISDWPIRWQALERACMGRKASGRWDAGCDKPPRIEIGPPATEWDVAQVEATLGCPIPSSFRKILLEYSGASASSGSYAKRRSCRKSFSRFLPENVGGTWHHFPTSNLGIANGWRSLPIRTTSTTGPGRISSLCLKSVTAIC